MFYYSHYYCTYPKVDFMIFSASPATIDNHKLHRQRIPQMPHARIQRRLVVALLTLVALVGACSSGPRIITNSAPDFDVASYRTFGFFRPLGTDRGNVQSLESKQLIASTTRELEKAGLRRDDSSPDLLVNFVISTRETLQSRPSSSVGVHHSMGRYGTWGGYSMGVSTTEVVQRTEGTLGVDLVDRARNQLVWEGAATARVTDQMRQNRDQALDSAIVDIFAQFP